MIRTQSGRTIAYHSISVSWGPGSGQRVPRGYLGNVSKW